MRVPVRGLSAVPHLSLNKFGAPLGYRRLALGLNVSYFFRSLGTANGARAKEQTRPSGSRRHNYVTNNCGQCWPMFDTCFRVPAVFCHVFICFVLGVAVELPKSFRSLQHFEKTNAKMTKICVYKL